MAFVASASSFDVLLITSRRRRRWVVPKGWPIKGLSLPGAAGAEAIEEAGIVGCIGDTALGVYGYRKQMASGYPVRCHVFVYPLLARLQVLNWPERDERDLLWCPLKEAAGLVDDVELGQLLTGLADSDGAPLRAFLTALGEAAQATDLSDALLAVPDSPIH